MVACQREDDLDKLNGLVTKKTPEEIKSMASRAWNNINTVPRKIVAASTSTSTAGATKQNGEYGRPQVRGDGIVSSHTHLRLCVFSA